MTYGLLKYASSYKTYNLDIAYMKRFLLQNFYPLCSYFSDVQLKPAFTNSAYNFIFLLEKILSRNLFCSKPRSIIYPKKFATGSIKYWPSQTGRKYLTTNINSILNMFPISSSLPSGVYISGCDVLPGEPEQRERYVSDHVSQLVVECGDDGNCWLR